VCSSDLTNLLTMVTPSAPSYLRRRYGKAGAGGGDSSRLLLSIACLWPLFMLVYYGFTTPPPNTTSDGSAPVRVVNPGLSFRKFLDRVDIMGYGPTHPRVAVIVVGDDEKQILSTVKSVFSNTDLDRLFIVCAVLDGVASTSQLAAELEAIDKGSVPHWHGLRPDMHKPGEEQVEAHTKKIHLMNSNEKQGIAASRSDAVDFISLLAKKHEQAGLKSPEEDLILLLMQSGANLESRKWLASVTSALIVAPPLLGVEDQTVSMKLANAVSFGLEGAKDTKAVSFDFTFTQVREDPVASAMALSDGLSFPTPAVGGEATAMRLETYVLLPAQDLALTDEWAANLDLSLNLWLCADGIDVLSEVTVNSETPINPPTLSVKMAARFAAAWMDEAYSKKVYRAIRKKTKISRLEWETFMSEAKSGLTFPDGMSKRCRSFSWFANEVNMSLEGRGVEEDEDVLVESPKKEPEKKKSEGMESTNQAPEKGKLAVTKEKKAVQIDELAAPDKPLEVPQIEGKEPEADALPPPREEQGKLPSKPLSTDRQDIVGKAQPIDISFEDASEGHKDHPHMGATDANGVLGYILDETTLFRNPPAYKFDNLEVACKNKDSHYIMLTERVSVDIASHAAADKTGKPRAKIFCLVYTIDKGHDNIPGIRETWGQKCDGFMVGSNKTDESIGAVNILHEGPEEYNNIWQKVRSMWSYIYDNYYEKYDWFHVGGDDLYLLVENLRLYLESEEIQVAQNGGIYLPHGNETEQTPLFLGRRFSYMGDRNDIFNSGGAGYTLNKAALKTLVVKGLKQYFPHAHTFSEDTMTAKIFRKFGVYPYDTKDEEGGERYMPFMPGHHLTYQVPANCKPDPFAASCKDWYPKYSIDIKFGKEHCAKHSVAFHYVKGSSMRRLHAILYGLCPS